MIPSRLLDNNLVISDPDSGYIVCILLRLLLGLLVYCLPRHCRVPLFVLCALVIIFSSYKIIITKNNTWKNYTKPLATYGLVGVMTIFNRMNTNNAGLLIMFDALMGMQTKFILGKLKE